MKKLLALITALICSFGALAAAGCNAGGGSDDNFVGLYDEVDKEEVTFTYTNDNMLYDFEEKEACYMNMSFDCIFGSASLNTDKKYLTCGNGSLKLDVYGRNGRKLVDRLFRYSVEIFRLYYRRFYFGRRYVRYRRFA